VQTLPRRKYPDAVKEQALALHTAGVGNKEIAQRLNVPVATITEWIYTDFPVASSDDDEIIALQKARLREREKLIETAWKLAHTAMEQAFAAMPNASAKDAANIAALMIDKALLLEGKATQRVEYELNSFIKELPDAVKAELAELLDR
jgi:transposase-like protein